MKRFLSVLICLSLISAPVCGSEQKGVYTVTDQSKGLNSHVSPYSVPENMATDAQNIRFNNGFRGIAKRPTMLTSYTSGSHAITGLHRYYKSDGTTKLVASGSTFLYVGDDDAGTMTTKIKTALSDGRRFQFVTYKDIMIGLNGADQPVKYDGKVLTTANTDGARTASELVAELGAPFAELNTGSNLDASSWYMYKVAFYNGSTYSYSTARSNPIATGSSVRDITLTDIPLGPTGTTQRIIYRTSGQANQAAVVASSTYYRVATISDNTTRTYNDAIDDTTIEADSAPTWATVSAGTNATPPIGAYPVIHDEKLFIGGDPSNLSSIYWSDTYNPDYFDPTEYRDIRPDDGDEVTFLREQLGILTIGKTNTIQKFYTTSTDTDSWYASAPFSFVGCPSPHSVAATPRGIIYYGRGGLYLFDGQYSTLISDAVTPEVNDVLATNVENVAGFYFKNEYQMAYTSAASGDTTNNRVLVYDLVRDAYSKDIKSINTFTAFDSGSDFGILYLGSSLTDGKIYADEGAPSLLIKRLTSEFTAGTYDDVANYGEENAPVLELAWDTVIDSWTGGVIDDIGGIIDRPDTGGTWTSPIYQINAATLGTLYWNESLNGLGDVTFAIKTASTSGGIAGASWSSEFTTPTGSDLSGLTANNFIQIRITLSTSDITVSPTLQVSNGYLFKMTYSKSGATPESSVLSVWQSGWRELNAPATKKLIERIKIYYTGTEGTMTFGYKNDEQDVDQSFTIDLAQDPATNTVTRGYDAYTGDQTNKIYTFFPGTNGTSTPSPIGQYFLFSITEPGNTDWTVNKIEVLYSQQPIFD